MPCFFGHKWGPWEKTGVSCTEQRKCTKCQKTEERIIHQYGEWEYEQSGNCQKIHRCQICGIVEKGKIVHQFGEWEYVKADSCQIQRRCENCGYIEYSMAQHEFDKKVYISKKSCVAAERCRRCNKMKIYSEIHSFSNPEYVNDYSCFSVKFCTRCGLHMFEEQPHKWDEENLYTECLQKAIGLISHKIEVRQQKLDVIGYHMDDDSKFRIINEISELQIKKINCEQELQTASSEVMGKLCTKCMQVVNLGVTQEDLKNAISIEWNKK